MENAEVDRCLSEISRGDKAAFEKLYIAFGRSVYLLTYGILRQREEAEDVTQRVFVKIWSSVGSCRPGGNPKAWIMTVARNEAIDAARKRRFELPSDGESADNAANPAAENRVETRVEERLGIEQALLGLGADERQIVAMRVLGGLTYLAIGRVLSMPVPTVAWKYKHCIKKLYAKLQDEEGGL